MSSCAGGMADAEEFNEKERGEFKDYIKRLSRGAFSILRQRTAEMDRYSVPSARIRLFTHELPLAREQAMFPSPHKSLPHSPTHALMLCPLSSAAGCCTHNRMYAFAQASR